MQHIQAGHGYSERRACRVIQFNRCSARRSLSEDRGFLLRARMLELAEDRRRFGSPACMSYCAGKGWCRNHKRTKRIYQEEKLSLCTRKRVKRPPCPYRSGGPAGPDEQLAMDFVSDSLMGGRCIRILTIADLWDRSSPALKVDMSLSGVRVVRVLEKLRLQERLPQYIKVDNVLRPRI